MCDGPYVAKRPRVGSSPVLTLRLLFPGRLPLIGIPVVDLPLRSLEGVRDEVRRLAATLGGQFVVALVQFEGKADGDGVLREVAAGLAADVRPIRPPVIAEYDHVPARDLLLLRIVDELSFE